ncbi:site-specific integrase [Bacteroides fragilis]|uniref:tyrosine-type recombinase/integrase n=1 Tax=Bacteroides fragilis TaxID=817 RepID=UPI002030BC69|nr:site-specific integrase [Bacteroides fragilis]MCM0239130.1 site-specific integrase [Bacteroides fragilis]
MATLKLAITPDKVAKDGTHKIRIALGHKCVTRYIVTRFKIDNLSQFKNGQVIKHPDAAMINAKLRNILNEYQEKLDSIKCIQMYDCKQLREILVNSTHIGQTAFTFQAVANSYITELIEDGRENYAKLLERNCRYFTEFTKGEFLLSEITPEIISNYDRFLRNKKGVGETTISMMMSRTRTIINRAIKKQLVKYDVQPFAYYSIKSSPVREVDITVENLTKIKNSLPKEKRFSVARDCFMLSFYLGGINLADLLEIDFRNTDKVEYVRKKARNLKQGEQRIVITIPEIAKPIIKEWTNRNTGKLDFGYKFTYSNFYRYLTRSLNMFAESLNINQKVVYYSARKTFAQFASELGIPDGVIDYCLGHSDKSKGVIRYYTKVKQKQAEIAINRVIDYVNSPEKYKDYIEMRADIMMMKG